jgi:hypothetical protein
MNIDQTRRNMRIFEQQCAGLRPVPRAQRARDMRIRTTLLAKIKRGELSLDDYLSALIALRLSDPATGLRPRITADEQAAE